MRKGKGLRWNVLSLRYLFNVHVGVDSGDDLTAHIALRFRCAKPGNRSKRPFPKNFKHAVIARDEVGCAELDYESS